MTAEIHLTDPRVGVHLRRAGREAGPPVLLVAGLGAGPAVYELQPERSLPALLQEAGRSPWLVDFDLPRRGSRPGAEALVGAFERAIEAVAARSRVTPAEVELVGHSLGGLLGLAVLADGLPLRRLAVLAAGVDYRPSADGLHRLLTRERVNRRLRGIRLDAALPVGRVAALAAGAFGRRVTLPMEASQFSRGTTEPDVVRRFMREAVRDLSVPLLLDLAALYSEEGIRLGASGRPLKEAVRDIVSPVLFVGARQDRTCPPGAVRAAAAAVPGAELLEVGTAEPGRGYGHVDLLTGRRAPDEVLRRVVGFLTGGRELP